QLAMLWMRKIRSTEKSLSFSEIADRLSPVLFRGVTFSKGKKAADYIAHLGWAMYLKHRDGSANPGEVQPYFDWAIKKDPKNAYAHAMLGFWMLFRRQPLAEVKPHFEIALASVDVEAATRPDIRDLQLSALLNSGGRVVEAETLRVADEVRREAQVLSREKNRQILQIYEMNWKPERWEIVGTILSPEAHLGLLKFLLEGQTPSEGKILLHRFIEARLYQMQRERPPKPSIFINPFDNPWAAKNATAAFYKKQKLRF
ncbi:MAG: hypothetical protein GXO75_04550, partial [Calditrichaeota bacterium]|nr:hypothetical protein [Calditrichota bacterium]